MDSIIVSISQFQCSACILLANTGDSKYCLAHGVCVKLAVKQYINQWIKSTACDVTELAILTSTN